MNRKILGALFLILYLSGCGLINTSGGGSGLNDARPTGSVVAQGNFTSQNGGTVTGTALVFSTTGNTVTLRLEGLSVTNPNSGSLNVQLYANPNSVLATNVALKSTSGNQNYTVTIPASFTNWTNVYIYSNTANQNIGAAALIAATP